IFFKMLENKDLIPCCTGMIQKEVAERIAASPGCKAYGILSILYFGLSARDKAEPFAVFHRRG
ncbi:hypothetical protein EZS27_039049, partial [termite gut metagenome]